ncbi:MAG: PepSY-like domain-containing protein [Bacteroidia bacterium]
MKNILLLAVCLFFSTSAIQAIEVPDVVETAFAKQFPTAQKVKWEKEAAELFEAEFMLDGKEVSAVYKADGTWQETETEIQVAELPQAVLERLKKTHPEAKIKEAAKIQRADNSVVYEAEIKVGRKETDLLFDANGNEVK